ncbi:uncharacterized protein LOC121833256 [Ixodes scapularis]|uniref:uncharacterized protein LOC121833256 n=1 Tax=Ixodes scapularis TaxID=6945 RepID=UPI001C392248|nr:uncharacterized protein LOC121833256 [Ixodes scapularis]
MFVIHNNVETEVFPLVDENGVPVVDGSGMVYVTEDGERVTLVFASEPDADPTVLQPARPPTTDVDGQLWSAAKTKFFIGCYKELKERLRAKGGFRTKRALWQQLADTVVGEFGGVVTADQAENKWKSLERAYKNAKSKNNKSGHSRVHFEYEDELHDILEKEHHISPTVLLAPGRVLEKEGDSAEVETSRGTEAGPSSLALGLAPPSNQRAPAGTPSKRKRETVLGSLLKVFADMEESRKKRHKDRMALLERLVTAIEKSAPAQ